MELDLQVDLRFGAGQLRLGVSRTLGVLLLVGLGWRCWGAAGPLSNSQSWLGLSCTEGPGILSFGTEVAASWAQQLERWLDVSARGVEWIWPVPRLCPIP